MDINNLLALDSNKQNYPNLNLPSDAKYYVSAEEYNTLIKALQSWITDYNAKVQALEDSVYRLPIVTVDSAAPLSDENILSSTRTLLEIIKELAKLDDKFLSSLTPDTAEGKITFKEGLAIGSDQKGVIDKYGNAELNSLKLRQWLEVPELRFNRVEVQMGDKWRSPGGGIIESVDLANNIITLKLTDGEIGAVEVGDLCVGIFHSMINENNATADVDDSKNNRSIKGFATCYFKVDEITETARNSKFKYSLREVSGNYPKQISPEAFMNFAVFGNTTNTNRQSSVFESRTYQRFLINVNNWEINKYNVAAQFGELSNLVALGLPNMSGYSAYLKNVYFSGTIFQVKPPKMMDGTWWEWDENLQDYVNTGVKVSHTGQSGFHHTLLNQSLSILGESSDFSHTWAELHVYEGSKELTYVTTTPTLPATYTVTLEGSGVSPGNLYIGTGTTPFAKTTPIQAMNNDTGIIKFTISGIGSDSKEFLFTVNQTFVKVSSGKAPYIGLNGNWWIWNPEQNMYVDSGVLAHGNDGKSPYIGENGNWWAWDGGKWYNTGIRAEGKDGKDIEYVFTRTRTAAGPDIPQTTDALPSGWTDNPVGVDDEWEYEWYIKRVRIDGVWGPWHYLQEWRHHVADGHNGKDGATREYIYKVNNDPNFNVEANRPTYSPEDIDDPTVLGWTDDPTNPGPEQQYEWYCYRDKTGGIGSGIVPGKWGPWKGPFLWSRWGRDGEKGDPGEPGINGSSAPLLYLSASSQIMTCSTSNVPHPGQTIYLEAKTQNIVIDDLLFEAIAYWEVPGVGLQSETVSLVQPGTDNRQRILTTTQWKPEYEKVAVKAYLEYLNDDVTIHRLADPVEGSSAVVGFLTNGNITFAGLSDGRIISLGISPGGQYENGHGEFWVYEGLQRQTTGVTFSVISQERCNVTFLQSPIGAYKITDYTITPLDSASAVLQAEYNGVTIKQVLTISVSRRGEVGQPGTNVPIVYRGVYNPNAIYYGNSARVDIVKIESNPVRYYRTDINTGEIQGISPINSVNVWVDFGANFESVATDLLLAERANIGGFVFYKDQIISQYGRYVTTGDTENFSNVPEASISNWYPNIVLDGLGGEIVINSATVRGSIEAEKGKIGGWLIGANTFTSQLASYTIDQTATPLDSGNLSYIQVTFWATASTSWVNTYTQHTNNKYMKIRYGDQAWPELNINFVQTGSNKETATYYEKHLQYEFGISSGLTTFPTAWSSYPAGLTSPLPYGSYLWIRQRSYQNILDKPSVTGLWSKPVRVSPVIMANTISPNISLNGADGTAIFSGGKVKFNPDGSGHIANGKISWTAAGDATYDGIIKAKSGIIGGWTLTSTSLQLDTNKSDGVSIFSQFMNFYGVRQRDYSGNIIKDGPWGPTGANDSISKYSYVWAGMGLNVFPASIGVTACARFENVTYLGSNSLKRTTSQYYYDYQNAVDFASAVRNPYISEKVIPGSGDDEYITVWTVTYDDGYIWTNDPLGTNYGVYINVKGASTNVALSISSGNIEGFRLRPKGISSGMTLTALDTFIVCYNLSPITLYLPAIPELGQVFYIYPMNEPVVTVNSNSSFKICTVLDNKTSLALIRRRIHMYMFDGQYWVQGTLNS